MEKNPWVNQVSNIRLALAIQALQAALQKADELKVSISVAIVNTAGMAIHTAHMEGAPFQCQDIALKKALTAVGFSASTSLWQERLKSMSTMVQQGLPLQKGMALFGGGEPFYFGAELIGAIGVSGASEEQDILCAKAAVERIKKML